MSSLISTKLAVQLRSDRIVARDRLWRLFDVEPGVRLVLVSAPAGFGKTVLLADWISRSGLRGGWLALDPGDNDVSRFLRYLVAAASRTGGSSDDGIEDASGAGADDAIAATVQALAGSGRPAVLVLDDYHVVVNPDVHRIVATLLERLPRNARLAIGTRADPPLALARLRARGELLEVRADALRFTEDEVASFMRRQLGEALAATSIETLTRRTEGWAAVVQLAAVSLRGSDDRDRFVREFGASHRFVLDFVADEVLDGLDADTREFLLRTSVLDRMCGPACEALVAGCEGPETLEALDRANLLLVPLDDERRWYRYHHLFRDLLRARLARQCPDLAGDLHRRAAAWHESAGYVDEAIGHAIDGGDVAGAVRLVRRHWLGWLHSGETWTVQRWLDALPVEAVAADPQLGAVYGWALVLRGESAGVEEWIGRSEAALEGPAVDDLDRAVVPTQLACLRANLAQLRGDGAGQLAEARRAVALLPDRSALPPSMRDLLEGDATLLVAHGLVATGQADEAAATFRQALPLLHRGGNMIASSHAVLSLAALEIRRGRPAAALELARAALEERWNPAAAFDEIAPETSAGTTRAGSGPDREPPALAAIHVAIAEALIAAARFDEARTELAHATELGRRGEGRALGLASDAQARLEAAQRAAESGRLAAGRTAGRQGSLVEPLTERELEVLRLVARGRSNREIAGELYVALGTVKAHLHTICGKLGAENRVQAIIRGREEGLLD